MFLLFFLLFYLEDFVGLLDLPNEMILAIMNKVKPRAILLCSIINIGNNRLEQLALEKCHSIDTSFDYAHASHELLFRRFYSDVLPCIYNNILSLTINLRQLLYIDVTVKAIDGGILPNLRYLKILAGRRRSYTGTPFTISKLSFISIAQRIK
jgi:hypothetical protein